MITHSKINLFDILSTSRHYCCRKLIGVTNENLNFDLRVSRRKQRTQVPIEVLYITV